ncbi:hypothetical protein V8C42DRAFT_316518 [Trichoderma barbatum]
MKVSALFSTVALAGAASAWNGQMASKNKQADGTQTITMRDYTTGSTYDATLSGGFTGTPRTVLFVETSPGGYRFAADLWKTSDGCHNINFNGAFDAGHGWCCGSLPCNLQA